MIGTLTESVDKYRCFHREYINLLQQTIVHQNFASTTLFNTQLLGFFFNLFEVLIRDVVFVLVKHVVYIHYENLALSLSKLNHLTHDTNKSNVPNSVLFSSKFHTSSIVLN